MGFSSDKSKLLVSLRKQVDSLDQSIFCLLENYYNSFFLDDLKTESQLELGNLEDYFLETTPDVASKDYKIYLLIKDLIKLLFEITPQNHKFIDLKHLKFFKQAFTGLLFLRFQIIILIGYHKKELNIAVLDKKRWQVVKSAKQAQTIKAGLPLDSVLAFWEKVHQFSCLVQDSLDFYS